MFIGTHMLLYSSDAAADRAFLRDVLGFNYVDAHEGWLIFGLPPAETGVHPLEQGQAASGGDGGIMPAALYLMTTDINAAVAELRGKGVECSDTTDQGWGILSLLTLPSGGKLGIYQPRHPLAIKA